MKSTAPSSSAWSVMAAPASVCALTMTTCEEPSLIMALRASMPFIIGMSTSSVTTSGLRANVFCHSLATIRGRVNDFEAGDRFDLSRQDAAHDAQSRRPPAPGSGWAYVLRPVPWLELASPPGALVCVAIVAELSTSLRS